MTRDDDGVSIVPVRASTLCPVAAGQGGEGMTNAKEWYIENVLEECDSPDEFFYDAKVRESRRP